MRSETATDRSRFGPIDADRLYRTSAAGMWRSMAFVYRYVRTLLRRPIGLLWLLGFPAGFYLLTIATFIDFSTIPAEYHGAVRATTALSYGVFGSILVSLTTVSGGLLSDLETDRFGLFRAIGIHPWMDLLGRVCAGLLAAAVSAGVVVAVSLLTGANYTFTAVDAPIVIGAFFASVVPWIAIAYFVAIITSSRRYATLIAVSVALAAYFATGFNGSVPATFTANPEWLNVLPNTLSTRLLVGSLVGIEDASGAGLTPPELPDGTAALGLLSTYAIVSLGALGVLTRRLYDGRLR